MSRVRRIYAEKRPGYDVAARQLCQELREALGTQVKVQYKGGKGSLQVYFNSDEQLRRFANLLGKEE